MEHVVGWKFCSRGADGVLCRLMMFLTVFFHLMFKVKYSCYQDSCYSWLVCLLGFWLRNASLVEVSHRKSDCGWHRLQRWAYSTSPCLMFERVKKSQAILALLDGFQELHLDWWAAVTIKADVFFSASMKTSVVYAASLSTFVWFETIIWRSVRFDIQNFKSL